ncbi:MAG: cytochrome c biogenesis protein CcsA [Proteobacteria bacterium]|nr:cytochrome c biogenesis protein CcsA [Pseudomonadota bacterium]
MLSELGNLFLVLAFGFGCVQVLASSWGLKNGCKWLALGRVSAVIQGGCIGAAFLILMTAFFLCDFSLLIVMLHDHTQLPWYYRLAATWGNHEGSLLLFVLILSGVGVAFAACLPASLLRARALVFQGFLSVLFLTFLWMTSNPFTALPFLLSEGQSLNPLLQDRGLLVHPPLLYLGYVGFSAPFSLALAALWGKEEEKTWTVLVRSWSLFAWGALTAGVTLGSWWAYYELGWGGWWFWDPVENVSLMPWLSGTALLHTLLIGKLYRWSLFLSLLTFGLSLFGTFLVRSGLMTSVHSFADDPERGLFMLGLIGGIMGVAFFMWAWRAPRLASAPVSLFSREGALLLNSLFLVVGLATLILGTVYPLWREGTLSIGAPYFERTLIPLMFPLFLLIPVGSMLREKKEPLLPLLIVPLTATLGGTTLILYFLYPASLLTLLGLGMGIWVMSGTLAAFLKRRLAVGAFLAHMGVAVSLLGVSGGGGFRMDETKVLGVQESLHVGGIPLTLQEVSQGKGSTYLYEKATLSYPGGVLTPEKRLYQPQNSLLSETAIGTSGLRDLYVTLGPYQGEGKWLVRASFIPLAPWIWVGGALMVLGAVVSFARKSVIASSAKAGRSNAGAKIKNWVASSLTLLTMTMDIQADSLHQKAYALAQEVRCPVCLGQSIVDSETPESETLKTFILERLQKGASEETIREQLRVLYGDEILFRPPFASHTFFLWLAPFGLFVCMLLGVLWIINFFKGVIVLTAPKPKERVRAMKRLWVEKARIRPSVKKVMERTSVRRLLW